MYNKFDIYCAFRKAQGYVLNKPYRLPKDFDTYFNTKMSEPNRKNLENVTNAFNTRWQNIDPETYFIRGFELFKTFSYTMFFNPKVIMYYVEKDKNIKRESNEVKKKIVESIKFAKGWLEDKDTRKDLSLATQYCSVNIDGVSAPVKHFVLNKIDKHFVVWLISRRILVPTETEEGLMPLVCENYRKYLDDINKIGTFLKEAQKKF